MPNLDLEKYINEAKATGASIDLIKSELLKQGWPEKNILEALNPIKTGVNLPTPPVPHFGMWITFQYVILFISLYVTATALGGILHHAVDNLLADELKNNSIFFYDGLLKGYLAAMIVAFPIFAVLFVYSKGQIRKNPAIKNIKERKALIYITLVVTFIIMIAHLISTIYSLLSGTTTMNTFAHLGVTIFVAGSIFGYLIHEVWIDRHA